MATIRMEPADRDIVPVQRWMYLDKADVVAHAQACGVASYGSQKDIAKRLFFMGRVTYSKVKHCSLLRRMLRREGLDHKGERPVLLQQLINNPPPPEARLQPTPAAPTASTRAAGKAPASALQGIKIAIPEKKPTQWRRELLRIEASLRAKGTKLTRELCMVYLAEWGLLPEDFAVYHIISPAAGGKDHPANYAMLPNYFPTDYHIEGKATLHHVLMLELLGKTKMEKALRAGLDEADEQELKERYGEIEKAVKAVKDLIDTCGTSAPVSRAAGGGAAAAAASVAGADAGGDGGDGEMGPRASFAPGACGADPPTAKRHRPDDEPPAGGAATPVTATPAMESVPPVRDT